MANYTQQLASDFWFEFDNNFMWKPSQQIADTLGILYFSTGEIIGNSLKNNRAANTFPNGFISDMQPYKASIDFIANEQLKNFDQHFANEPANEQKAFEDFGQGILYDVRRKGTFYKNYVIHTMDASTSNPPIGYHRWYQFIRAYTLLNNINDGRWLSINRNVALAWYIQSKLKPKGTTADGSNPNNPPLAEASIKIFRDKCSIMSFQDLDNLFSHSPYPI